MKEFVIKSPTRIPAGQVEEGQCFRKFNGSMLYLRIRQDSLSSQLSPNMVWAVNLHHGGLSYFPKDAMVVQMNVDYVNFGPATAPPRPDDEDEEEEEAS